MKKRSQTLLLVLCCTILITIATCLLAVRPLEKLAWSNNSITELLYSLSPLILAFFIICFFKRRTFLFFWSLFGSWVLIYLAIPIIYVFHIDWILPGMRDLHPGFLFAFGYLSLLTFIVGSLCYVIFPALATKDNGLQQGAPSTSINPADGLTLQQIKNSNINTQYHFLFGEADEETIASWGIWAKTIAAASRTRLRMTLSIATLLLLFPSLIWVASNGNEGRIQRDIQRIWETTDQNNTAVSTPRAFNAARRLFVKDDYFIGKNIHEIRKFLHFEKMNPNYELSQDRGDVVAPARFILCIDDGKKSLTLALFFNEKNLCTGGYALFSVNPAL